MNVLFVSIAFPPKNDPECLQTARYFKYLSREADMKFEVLTSSIPTLFMQDDPSLRPLDTGYENKVELPIYESKLTNFIMRKVGLQRMMFPDSKMTFHWQWKRALRKLKLQPDIVYSRSQPISSAFMAAKLKTHFGVPWMLHFSDPWALSPLNTSINVRELEAERRLIEVADKVTFTTLETVQTYARQYPDFAQKFEVTTNVFDPDEEVADVKRDRSGLRVVYTGGLAGQRSLFFLDDVLAEAEAIDRAYAQKIEIIVAGPMDRTNASYFQSTRFKSVTHVGEVPYSEAKKLQQSAHVLLVVDNPTNPLGAVFFPSKLLDYFLTGIKILAVTPENSVTSVILKNYPSACFTHQNTKAIAAFLIEQAKNLNATQVAPRAPLPEKFSARYNAARLADIFRALVKSN